MIAETVPENALVEDALKSALLELKQGDILSYSQIDNLAKGKRWILNRARRKVELETGAIFATIRGLGVKRLIEDHVDGIGVASRKQIVRQTSQVLARMSAALKHNHEHMGREIKLRITTEASRQSLIIEIAKD